jgi:GNAT superfamily N-acetyltransferase
MLILVPVPNFGIFQAQAFLWTLFCERTANESISHQAAPSYIEHCDFVAKHPYRTWRIVVADQAELELPNGPVGMIYVTEANEIGVQVLGAFRRRGIARRAIVSLLNELEPNPAIPGVRSDHWLANINPANEKSIALFESLGFSPVQITYRRNNDAPTDEPS